MQYVPKDGLYVYFRYDANQTVMCIMNTGDTSAKIDFTRYAERTTGFTKVMDVVTGSYYPIAAKKGMDDPQLTDIKMEIAPMQMWILELKK